MSQPKSEPLPSVSAPSVPNQTFLFWVKGKF